MRSHIDGSLKDGMSSGEDGGRNQGQLPQHGAREEPLEQVRIWTVVDNNIVAVFDKKYVSGRKIPSDIVGKGIVSSSGLEDLGGGKTWRTKGAPAGGPMEGGILCPPT